MTSRRSFLKTAAAGAAVLGLGARRALAAGATPAVSGNAKNIIYMVCDGMNIGALSAARHYQKHILGRENAWTSLFNTHPVSRSLMETASATGIVTDSAASSSCWGCGSRIYNGKINISVDGKPLEPLLVKARRNGLATGLVTTATVTHATPAGFAANAESRHDEIGIAGQYLDRHIDVILGGGKKFFDDALREKFRAAGYALFSERDDLKNFSAGDAGAPAPMLGLFSQSHIPFSIDRSNDARLRAKIPTLAEMTAAALAQLSKASGGFILQIEGARIDMAAHGNDAAALIHDLIAFDDAVALARDFTEKHPDTLLIITTDHGTGGFNINGTGNNYADTDKAFARLAGFKKSYEKIRCEAAGLSGPKLGDYLADAGGIPLSPPELEAAKGLKNLQKIYKPHTGIGWTSGNHTGDLVEFTALGAAGTRFPTLLRNDEVHGLLLKTLGIS